MPHISTRERNLPWPEKGREREKGKKHPILACLLACMFRFVSSLFHIACIHNEACLAAYMGIYSQQKKMSVAGVAGSITCYGSKSKLTTKRPLPPVAAVRTTEEEEEEEEE